MRTLLMISGFLCAIGCAAVPRGDSATPTSSRSGTTDVGGTRMHYEVAGAGQPILLIHAGIADCGMWDGQMGPLSRRYMVIRCDLRGFGGTPRGSVRFSHYRDVAALLDSLGIETVHIVGSSFGGRVAMVKEMQLHNYSLPSPIGAESIPLEPRAMTRLGDIRAKTLILIGNKDVPSFQSLSATAAREIPNARMMVIPDVAHMINMEKPETFNRILLEYLEDK